jgi:hypothetical protein
MWAVWVWRAARGSRTVLSMGERTLVLLVVLCGLGLFASSAGDAAFGRATLVGGVHCGTERWPIKTLSDPDADEVDFGPRSVTVAQLLALRRPAHVGDLSPRIGRVERRTYTVTAGARGGAPRRQERRRGP